MRRCRSFEDAIIAKIDRERAIARMKWRDRLITRGIMWGFNHVEIAWAAKCHPKTISKRFNELWIMLYESGYEVGA